MVSAAISAGASLLGSAITSKGKKSAARSLRKTSPLNVVSPGRNIRFNTGVGGFEVTPGESRTLAQQVRGFRATEAGGLAQLRSEVEPTSNRLLQSRLAQVESRRRAAVGNVREQLARRRVLGSSFGADAVSRTEAEFAQLTDQITAESFAQSLEARTNLLQREIAAQVQGVNAVLADINLGTQLAAQLTASAQGVQGANARAAASLQASAAQDLGDAFSFGVSQIGEALGDIFKK